MAPSSVSKFVDVEVVPPSHPLGEIWRACRADTFEKKIDLAVGMYRTDDGKPWVLPVVKRIEERMAAETGSESKLNHQYREQFGFPEFINAAKELTLGKDCTAIAENRAITYQSLSGCGALGLASTFLSKCYNKGKPRPAVYFSDPTWFSHHSIFDSAGFTDLRSYRYWDAKNRDLDFEGMIEDLANAPMGSLVVLHACAHNPTGTDPTREQWEKIADVCKDRDLFPVFDFAYGGFTSGDPHTDAWSIRHFVEKGFELVYCQSFAKNFGIYDERAGVFTIIVKDAEKVQAINTHVSCIIRGMYGSPPHHGARIVATILNDEALRKEWLSCVEIMANRIKEIRKIMYEKLVEKGTPGSWEHLVKQSGMFSFLGLNRKQCDYLKDKKHVYLNWNGRFSVAGLNTKNVDYFVECVHDAATNKDLQ